LFTAKKSKERAAEGSLASDCIDNGLWVEDPQSRKDPLGRSLEWIKGKQNFLNPYFPSSFLISVDLSKFHHLKSPFITAEQAAE
jgi:hypothetical protein